jgi:hypothetical protein
MSVGNPRSESDNGVVRNVADHGAGGDTATVRGTILQSLAVTLALSLLALSALLFAGFAAARILALRQSIPFFEGLQALLRFAPLAVFFGLLVCLGLYPSDRPFLDSFAGALKDTLGRQAVR